jgi:Flp pilus assembly protein TadG
MQQRLHPAPRPVQSRNGIAAVELAVIMPLVAILLLGLLEVGRIVQVNEILNNAAREGARKASTGINTFADVQTTVQNYLTNAGITNQTGLVVTVYDVTQNNSGPQFNPSTAVWLDQLQVTVSLPLANVQLAALHFLSTDPGTVLNAKAVWFSNQDQAYPTNITPPAGN